jgi:hypothetical protein
VETPDRGFARADVLTTPAGRFVTELLVSYTIVAGGLGRFSPVFVYVVAILAPSLSALLGLKSNLVPHTQKAYLPEQLALQAECEVVI